VTTEDYRSAFDAAIEEYETLGVKRHEIDDRLAQLAQTITTLCRLLGLTPTVPMGLTDACRLVYRNTGIPLSPTDVRDRLLAMGFDLSAYSNEMAVIHTTLRRLFQSGELGTIAAPGKHLYTWKRPAQPVRTMAISPEVAEYIRSATPRASRTGARRRKKP
jgi:hypothetical protein